MYCCRLKDDLVARARAGDAEALRLLIGVLPADMPASVRTAARDGRIRTMAIWLSTAMSGATTHRVAELLADAGAQLAAGQKDVHGGTVSELADTERLWLTAEIASVLLWARWPKLRRIIDIIGE
jgi:uncharacterized protein YfaQ (DUF2300 family)